MKIYTCNICGKTFDNPQKYGGHYGGHLGRRYKKKEREEKRCKNCGNLITKEHYRKVSFCSIKCGCEWKQKELVRQWKANEISGSTSIRYEIREFVRHYLFEKYDNKCAICGWHEINPATGKIPLQVDHIDGNYTNNTESNLILLCPNCHSLTPTYGRLNLGHGRSHRTKKGAVAQSGEHTPCRHLVACSI